MKNIEINYLDVDGYEVLYPKTNLEQIEGFQEFREGIYSKKEVDGIIELLREQTGNLKFTMGSYKGTEELWGDQKTGVWMQIELGFTPEYFVVSEEQKNYAYYPYFLGQNSNLGFGPYFYVAKNQHCNRPLQDFKLETLMENCRRVMDTDWILISLM